MRQHKLGKKLLAYLALFLSVILLTDCRSSNAPPLDPICLSDGFGGCDGARPDGTPVYLSPSQMGQEQMWCAPNAQIGPFMAWAYDTSVKTTRKQMSSLLKQAVRMRENRRSSMR